MGAKRRPSLDVLLGAESIPMQLELLMELMEVGKSHANFMRYLQPLRFFFFGRKWWILKVDKYQRSLYSSNYFSW